MSKEITTAENKLYKAIATKYALFFICAYAINKLLKTSLGYEFNELTPAYDACYLTVFFFIFYLTNTSKKLTLIACATFALSFVAYYNQYHAVDVALTVLTIVLVAEIAMKKAKFICFQNKLNAKYQPKINKKYIMF